MSVQFHFENKFDELLHAVPVQQAVINYFSNGKSPFLPLPLVTRLKIRVTTYLLSVVERFLSTKLYVENKLGNLVAIDVRCRSLIVQLLKIKLIKSWKFAELSPDSPKYYHSILTYGAYTDEQGKVLPLQGSSASGVGFTPQEALIPALAEVLERQSVCTWATIKVRSMLADPSCQLQIMHNETVFYNDTQLKKFNNLRDFNNSQVVLDWVVVNDLVSSQMFQMPAKMVFIDYCGSDQERQKTFLEITTNGAAAAVSYKAAAIGGIAELIERDSFFVHWLNQLTPPQLDLKTVTDPVSRSIIDAFLVHGFELTVLDITTDLEFPTLCAVLVDRRGAQAVTVESAAGFSVVATLQKLLRDTLRNTQNPQHRRNDDNDELQALLQKSHTITTFAERRHVWSYQNMIPKIDFLRSGTAVSYADLTHRYTALVGIKNDAAKLHFLQSLFKKHNHCCYLIDVTSSLARASGLRVAKAVAPDLIPAYFHEAKKPLGLQRVYHAPVRMGVRDVPLSESDLNQTPHPFI